MTLRVLHLGWKPVADLRALHALGASVTCAAVPADLPAARESAWLHDVVPVADARSAESVLAGLARQGLDLADFDVVSPANELEIVPASLLQTMNGTPGIGYRSALALRDKFVQKQLIRRAGLPVTDCTVVSSLDDVELPDGGKVVIKPLAGAATIDTHLVSDPAGLAALREDVTLRNRLWLVERFVEGSELHLDGVVRGGRLRALTVSRYLNSPIAIKSGVEPASVLLHPVHHPDLYQRAADLMVAALTTLQHTDGAFHTEVFLQPDGSLVFSELGGRIGGGGIPGLFKNVLGVDLHEEWARSVMGLDPAIGEDGPAWPVTGTAGWIHLKAAPGRVLVTPAVEDIQQQVGVVDAEVRLVVGEPTPDVTVHSASRAGCAVMVGDDETEVERRLLAVSRWFTAQVTVTSGAEEA
ncbi:ATP-grasp domain-containing protein [Micromonospora chersina]|uniref:ATP-grasp domain-containing protein n=1 Tax=Micromonospora chersina TaxID=47854 RepID=UPI0033C6B324